MSEKQRTFEAEAILVKTPKVSPETKPEETTVKRARTQGERSKRRTFSRDTVVRLIDWFKQG
jgi:hypothetical protein